jgi:hypothetical protein
MSMIQQTVCMARWELGLCLLFAAFFGSCIGMLALALVAARGRRL